MLEPEHMRTAMRLHASNACTWQCSLLLHLSLPCVQNAAERGVDGNYERAFYMPAVADRAVVSFYK